MYTDEDLNSAVKEDIFTVDSVEAFRRLMSSSKHSPTVDEENFRLISGFNDIFIVVASLLLLFSSLWILKIYNIGVGFLVFTVLSWILSEIFVRKRKMALPAITLLLSFVGGVFFLVVSLNLFSSEIAIVVAFVVSALAAYGHWLRFNVPITIAVGTAAILGVLVAGILVSFPSLTDWIPFMLFACGLFTFALAMYWDASDTLRVTRRSDVAFWLHLLSAPLIIHPVFTSLKIFQGNESLGSLVLVFVLYVIMGSISIIIDRRAFMLSSLTYVLYALSAVVKMYGGVGYGFAATGVFLGGALLLLSAYWHPVRGYLVVKLPDSVKQNVPSISRYDEY